MFVTGSSPAPSGGGTSCCAEAGAAPATRASSTANTGSSNRCLARVQGIESSQGLNGEDLRPIAGRAALPLRFQELNSYKRRETGAARRRRRVDAAGQMFERQPAGALGMTHADR